jgi:uncharacterized protein with PIN domain
MHPDESLKFIVDHNVAKLARWLRMMGYDAIVFDQPDDWQMIRTALAENRIVITKDTGVMKRRVITSGKLRALLIIGDEPETQIQQVIETFQLNNQNSLSLCLECNVPLVAVKREEIKDRIPPYVYQTKSQFVECPVCLRVYWQGTHWEAMTQTLSKLSRDKYQESGEEKIT